MTLKLKIGQSVRIELWGKHEDIIDYVWTILDGGYVLHMTGLTGLDDAQVTPVTLETSPYKDHLDMETSLHCSIVGIEVRGSMQRDRAEFLMHNLPYNCMYEETGPLSRTPRGILWIGNRNMQIPETFVDRCEHYVKRGTKCPLYEPGCPRNKVVHC